LWRVDPTGNKTPILIGDTANLVLKWVPTDAKIGPDGNFYYFNSSFPNTKNIQMVILNPASMKDSTWYTFSPVKNVICGDFDKYGYLYAAGRKAGIQVIRPDRSRRQESFYATDTITSARIFNDYLYVAMRSGIWRHSISDSSAIGPQELVMDLSQGILAGRSIKAFSFSSDGSKLFIGTDSQYPIVVANITTLPITMERIEPMYKDILPANCKHFSFGTVIYSIFGNAVYKVDVGTSGAPYYH